MRQAVRSLAGPRAAGGGVGPRSTASRRAPRRSPAGTPPATGRARPRRRRSTAARPVVERRQVAVRRTPSSTRARGPDRPARRATATPAMTRSSRPRTPASSEPHGSVDGDLVGEAGQLGRRRLGSGDDEQGVRASALALGLRGTTGRLDHRRGVRIDADGQGPGLGGGTGQHGPAVTGPQVDGHPLGAGDQVGDLADVHVHGTPTHHESHARESTLGHVTCRRIARARRGHDREPHPAAGHDRHPRRRPARADARAGGPGDGLPDRGPRPGPRVSGRRRRRLT